MTSDDILKRKAAPKKLSLPSISPEAWKNLVRERKLEPAQEHKLALALEHLAKDLELEGARRESAPRDRITGRIKRIETRLRALIEEMDRAKEDMPIILSDEIRVHIGGAMTLSAIGASCGPEAIQEYLKSGIVPEGTMSEINSPIIMEEGTRLIREMLGRKYGHVILGDFLEGIHKPMAAWVEKDKLKKRSVNDDQWLRWCIIYHLARSAPEIIGREPGISETGPFVELCAAVLRAMQMSDTGVGKVAVEMVRQLQSDEGRGPPRKPRARPRKQPS